MSFAVAAEAYDRFMGRYSNPLALVFADFAGVAPGQRVIDVGAGPGALTTVLAERLGAGAVTAVEPSDSFVDALRARHPDVTVLHAAAESLPLEDDSFDTAIAQLVVHFMKDPILGVGEMRRVTAPGGVVAANVWDHGGGRGPLSVYWEAVRELDPSNTGEGHLAGATQGDLTRIFEQAGLTDIEEESLTVTVEHGTFEEWWEPYTLGVGPAGSYVAGLDPGAREELRERCRELLSDPPIVVSASAWSARARV
jgi:SAM-dependent methyltransferase